MGSVNKKISQLIVYMLIGCIPLINLQLFRVVGAGIKPLHIVFLFSIIYCAFISRVSLKRLVIGVTYLVIPVLPLYRIGDILEWTKSYLIYVLIVLFVVIAFPVLRDTFANDYQKNIKLILIIIMCTQIIGAIQFVSMNLMGSSFLTVPFGSLTYGGPQTDRQFGFVRAYSVYLEPSFFAWISNLSLGIALFCNKTIIRRKEQLLFCCFSIVGVMCSLSASGMIFTILIIAAYFVTGRKAAAEGILLLSIGVLIVFCLLLYTDILNPIKRISSEISSVGSSGYERLVTPLLYLKKVLEEYPLFGRGLGQEGNVDRVGIIGKYPGIHNALLGIASCFGISSVAYYGILLRVFTDSIENHKEIMCMWVAIIAMYCSSGAYVSLDTFLPLTIMLLVILAYKKEVYTFNSIA